MIRISEPRLGPEVESLVLDVLRSGRLVQGPMVERLEAGFRELTGTAHAIAVSSGTTALVASIQALDLRPGDEVVTSAFTFAATLNAILQAGATAVFADIGDDFTIDPHSLAEVMSDRTRVVMPVHLYGLAAPMDDVTRIASERGATVVEDAAQAHGAMLGERPVGSYGLACFSLYATKNIAAGEGGVITTDDAALADRLRLLRSQGMRQRYEYELIGHNYRLTDLQAAVAIPQLERLDESNARRRSNAEALTDGLQSLDTLRLPRVPPGHTHVFHQYTIEVLEHAPLTRDQLAQHLLGNQVEVGIYYPRPVFDYGCYRDHPLVSPRRVPRTETAARRVLSLPVHPGLSTADLDRIVAVTHEALRG